MQSWKHALPAFRVPFNFVLEPLGTGLRRETPTNMSWRWITWVMWGATGGIVALGAAARGHLWRLLAVGTRVVCGAAGVALPSRG